MRIIAVGGEPGSGKSTLMWKLINHYQPKPMYEAYKLVPYLQKDNIYFLGKYEEGEVFSGTDRMSMAVQPEAIKFLNTLDEHSIVLYEGDRLFTSSFLEDCAAKYSLEIIYLSTLKEVRTARYAERGSNQNETWLRGRESKIGNILTNFDLMFLTEKFLNNNLDDQKVVFNMIVEKIDG